MILNVFFSCTYTRRCDKLWSYFKIVISIKNYDVILLYSHDQKYVTKTKFIRYLGHIINKIFVLFKTPTRQILKNKSICLLVSPNWTKINKLHFIFLLVSILLFISAHFFISDLMIDYVVACKKRAHWFMIIISC